MRVRFKKADLLPAATVVQSVANPQSTLPILSNVLISTEQENLVSLSATDYETRVKIDVAAEIDKKGITTVPARTFYDLVKELPEGDEIILEVKEKSALIRCRDIRAELQSMPARDFPKWPEVENKVSFELNQKDLKFLLEKILFAIPVRDPRKVLLGALFEFRNGGLNAIATDGKILGYARINGDEATMPKETNVVIPHKILEELTKSLGGEGTIGITFDERQVAFQLRNILYLSNQIEGKYPNYEAVIPKEFSRELRFQKAPMLAAIRRAAVLTDIKNTAITMAFSGDKVSVEAESYDKGRIREEVPAVTDGNDFRIVFNFKFIVDVLKAIDKDEVVLQANQPTTPAVFHGSGVADNFYLVMPIKLTEIQEYADDEPRDEREEEEEPQGEYAASEDEEQ